jgi:hypothetical protein
MELEGFIRAVNLFQSVDLNIKKIVTDRHSWVFILLFSEQTVMIFPISVASTSTLGKTWQVFCICLMCGTYPKVRIIADITLLDTWPFSAIILGLLKKLESAAYDRDSYAIRAWIPSLINHLYWCASSCSDNEPDLKVAKWRSVVNHVQDQHEGHDPLFPKCLHPTTSKRWIEPGMNVNIKKIYCY